MRQGFAAILERPDGSVVVATGSRWEQAALFTTDGDRLVVGLHPRDLADVTRPLRLDADKLADLVALHDDPATTVYAGVRRIPLGHALTWRPGGRPEVRRWFAPSAAEDRTLDATEAAALLRAAVTDAVAASLPADGDVAALLSGGLDSSTVTALAARRLAAEGRTLHAFTHVPLPGTADPDEVWEADDGPLAAEVARAPGISWTPVANTGLVTPLEASTWWTERTWLPAYNPANQPWVNDVVARAESAGLALLLTGAAGNATYSRGRQGVLGELARSRRWRALRAQVRQRREREGVTHVLRDLARETVPQGWVAAVRSRRTGAAGLADLPFRPERLSDAARDAHTRLARDTVQRRDDWVALSRLDGSRFDMLQSGTGTTWWSDPLSDPEVMTLALRIPEDAWAADGLSRGLARRVAHGVVPDSVRLRTTYGSQAADVSRWVAGHEGAYRSLVDRFRDSALVREIMDVDRLAAAIGPDLTGPTALEWQSVWGRAFAIGQFVVWHEEEPFKNF